MFPLVASAQTASSTADLRAVIEQLKAQIQLLQAQVSDLQNQVQSVKIELNFTRALAKGARGDDVKQLQEFLKTFPDVYPEGLVTGYFGPLTEVAVKKFQEQNGIEAVGIVGPKTQAKLTELATTGAGKSSVIPSGLTSAGNKSSSTPSGIVPTTPAISATPAIPTTSSTSATPAVPVTPATPALSGGSSPPPTPTPSPSPSATTITTSSTTTTSTSDTTPPSTPANLSANTISSSQINISWTGSTDNVGVIGYKIYRGGTQITASTSSTAITTYSDTGLQASTTYTYTVVAYDAVGNNSAQSATVSATTNPPPPPISTLPDAPVIASITPYVPLGLNEHFISSVTLQWNAVNKPSGYLSYYKAWQRLGNGDLLCWTNTEQTTFPDVNIGRGTYYYRVNACYTTTGSPLVSVTDICSSGSNIMTVTLTGGGDTSDTTPPSTPTGLTASIVNSDSPYISWTASTDNVGVSGYNIYRNDTYLKSVSGTPTIDDSVSRSTTSSYTVTAYDAAGNESAQSSPVSATPLSIGTPSPLNNRTPSLANVLESLRSLTLILQKLQGLFR